MDQYVRNLLKKKISIGTYQTEMSQFVFLAVITLLAISVRISVRTFVAQDWDWYWSVWLDELRAGGFRAGPGSAGDSGS